MLRHHKKTSRSLQHDFLIIKTSVVHSWAPQVSHHCQQKFHWGGGSLLTGETSGAAVVDPQGFAEMTPLPCIAVAPAVAHTCQSANGRQLRIGDRHNLHN